MTTQTYLFLAAVAAGALEFAAYGAIAAWWLRRRKRKAESFVTDDKGTVAIEFAVLLIPMLMIVALTVDMGMAVTAKQQMQSATYEAARAGANGGDPSAVFAAGLSGSIKDTATVSCATAGNVVTCDGTGTYRNALAGLPGVGALSNIGTHAVAFKPAGG